MRIIQLLPELNEGGVERGTVDLNREFIKHGHDSFVISAAEGKLINDITEKGGIHIPCNVCSKNVFTIPQRVLSLRKIFKQLEPDIIHARSRVPAWLSYWANNSSRPFVTTMHGIYSVNRYSKIMTMGDRVICVSSIIRDYAINNYNVDQDKLRVIDRGVDLNSFTAPLDHKFISNFKAKHNLDKSFIVTAVGRITHLKDYETFIRAISLASAKISNIKGLIIGGWDENSEYFKKIKKMLINDLNSSQVILAGSQTKIPEIYNLSDITANLSLTMGNVARTVIESIAMDRPVVCTAMEGLESLIQDGLNGYIVPIQNPAEVAQKITKLWHEPLLGVKQTLNPNFTLPTMADKTIDVYRELHGK